MDLNVFISECIGFQWDKGNEAKSLIKHHVSQGEAEQIFFNEPLILQEDEKHSKNEVRFLALGRTDEERFLFAVFTIREKLIRIISVRDMSRKERSFYEKA